MYRGDSVNTNRILENSMRFKKPFRGAKKQEAAEPERSGQTSDPQGSRHLGNRTGPVIDGILALLMCLCILWTSLHVHPGGIRKPLATPEPTAVPTVCPTAAPTPVLTPDPEITPSPTPVPTPTPTPEPPHYTIAPRAAAAPAPVEDAWGSVPNDDPEAVMEVIRQARQRGLLREDETMAFRADADFYTGSHRKDIRYYLDDTILMIAWKEVIDGNSCTLTEVKIADPTQFRRKLAGDRFGSGRSQYASALSNSVNAVVAMNADFYSFRDLGIVVYEGEICRFNTAASYRDYAKYNCIPTLFVTGKGDFVYFEQGEEHTLESVEAFVRENDVDFSLAFGPILVKDGEAQEVSWYPLGEALQGYSRAGIGQVDELHYLYFSLNHGEKAARWTVNDFAKHFAEYPVRSAYCLDGGQTGEVVIQGKPYNYIDFGAERAVSDILYFASALPEDARPAQEGETP